MTYSIAGRKWGSTSSWGRESGTIYWSAAIASGLQYDTGRYDLGDFQTALRDAFQAWEDVADVDFEEVAYGGGEVQVEMGPLAGNTVGLARYTYYERPGIDQIIAGEITLDSDETWAPRGQTDLNFYAVAVHEIGHILGLDHVDDYSEIMNHVVAADRLGDGDIAGIRYIYGEPDHFAGSAGADLEDRSGSLADEVMSGYAGDDTLRGGAGNDRISGGAGYDVLEGNDGADMLADLFGGTQAEGGNGSDVLLGGIGGGVYDGGADGDLLLGGPVGEDLRGGAGNDVILGEAPGAGRHGHDTIEGGAGDDLLSGGGGADTFVFRPGDGNDTIAQIELGTGAPATASAIGADFTPGHDRIALTGFGYADGAEALSHVADSGGHATFSDQGTLIVLHGLSTADLSAADFFIF